MTSKSENTGSSWALVNSDQAVFLFFWLLRLLYPEGEDSTLVCRGSMYQSTVRNNQE